MPIADQDITPVNLTDQQKVDRALRQIKSILKRTVQGSRRTIGTINKIVKDTPGGKAAIVSAAGDDAAEAQAIISKLVAIVNNHKATNSDDVSF